MLSEQLPTPSRADLNMITKIDISGEWQFRADGEMSGSYLDKPDDIIILPSTVSLSGKGRINNTREEYHLTDEHSFEGYAWYYKAVDTGIFTEDRRVFLFLERTRMTDLWVNGQYAGSCRSLCTPHVYDITPYLVSGRAELCVRVCNAGYPTKGGHMTSPDTQTNWNGITGEISLRIYDKERISRIRAFPDLSSDSFKLEVRLEGTDSAEVNVWGASSDGKVVDVQTFTVTVQQPFVTLSLGSGASRWSAADPVVYTLKAAICGSSDIVTVTTGLREFRADGRHFRINGEPVLLRGKHDAMVFPLTGAAPTTVGEWHNVFMTAKNWGINHYRFHTCCPPEAAFAAADIAGIYLQPELPFWGEVPAEKNEEFGYLLEEGRRILDEFGDHPSFVMMSLGNELWGDRGRLSEMLHQLKEHDPRHLFVQGSNNYQFSPEILPDDDFFSGVRFDRERLIRGSFASCDKPFGFVQTEAPNTVYSYDDKAFINPENEAFLPDIPTILHEIGQYSVFPDIRERKKYTGPLKARYMDICEERLRKNGMLAYADELHEASGMLAFSCYKLEIEAALRSHNTAGFQLLDLQDFPGQCVALVGMLDPFMEEKSFVRRFDLRRLWNGFCSDIVILAEFGTFVAAAGETLHIPVWIRNMSGKPVNDAVLHWKFGDECRTVDIPDSILGLYCITTAEFIVPHSGRITAEFELRGGQGDIIAENCYELWAYPEPEEPYRLPEVSEENGSTVYITSELSEAVQLLSAGERVLYLPKHIKDGVRGTYCTDFWSYTMFRFISEDRGCELPAGTQGLLIDNKHPALGCFECEFYSTPQWYSLVDGIECAVLDKAPADYRPIVQMIDNPERCHKLGVLFEAKAGRGRLMVCMCRPDGSGRPETAAFFRSILDYMHSERFQPGYELSFEEMSLR